MFSIQWFQMVLKRMKCHLNGVKLICLPKKKNRESCPAAGYFAPELLYLRRLEAPLLDPR